MRNILLDQKQLCNSEASDNLCIIIGCQCLRRSTWEDALGIARNGSGYVRLGRHLIWCWSESWEAGALQ